MADIQQILVNIQIAIFALFMLLALIYSIPILCLRRFHNINNVFTVNLCFAALCCGMYWLTYYVIVQVSPQLLYGPNTCIILGYFQIMCTIQVPLALTEVSVYRLCAVIYHTKAFFRKQRWVIICIGSQWATGILLTLPPSLINTNCSTASWVNIYTLLIVVIIPSVICLIMNIIIFKHVRASTNRIQASSAVENNTQHMNRRDLHLLQHIIVMFCIFVGGWTPVYLYGIISTSPDPILVSCFIILAELSVTLDILNLFFFNHDLRRFLIEKFFICH